jgi:hypothetical protein
MRRALLLLLPCLVAATPSPDRITVEREVALGIPPQPPRASDLYRRARPFRGATFQGMLVCSVEVVGNGWDGGDPSGPVRRLAGRPEVDVELYIGEGTRPVRYFGPEDAPNAFFAVPNTTLSSGTKLKLVVEDRDLVRNDPVGTVEMVFEGELPVRGSVAGARVECRAVGEREVEAGTTAAEGRLTRALAPLADVPDADADAIDFGFDHEADTAARLAAYDLARWVGLTDTRVTAALARLDERARVFTQRATSVVTSLRANTRATDVPFRLPGTAVDARVGPQRCDSETTLDWNDATRRIAMRCGIPLAIEESESTRPPALTFHAIDAQGGFTEVEVLLVEEDGELIKPRGGRLPAGAQRLVLGLSTDTTVYLRIGVPTGVVFVNVGRPAR